MARRRAKSEIIADILHEAFEASAKTKLLHRTNMNIKYFPRYLQALHDGTYIESLRGPDGTTLYRTTKKGRELLGKLREIQEVIEDIRKKRRSTKNQAIS